MSTLDKAWFDELSELLRIKSVSADPAHGDDVVRAADWVADKIRRGGGEAELVPYGERPLVVGEIRASSGADSAPTILCYGHFDVQPPAPLDLWESDPFEATIRDEWLYARGVADDKGQLWMLLHAAGQLAAEGALPINIRIVSDGEEEVGGQSIVEFLEQDERGADACVIFDGGMESRDLPALSIATRGLAAFNIRVHTGERDLHSGMYGGAVLNAAHVLMAMLAEVAPDAEGRVRSELAAGVAPVAAEERESWKRLPPGAPALAAVGAAEVTAGAGDEYYERTGAATAVDVNMIEVGEPRTIVPSTARGHVSVRLAPGQQAAQLAPELERLLRAAAPPGAEVDIEVDAAEPALFDPSHPALRLAEGALERACGTPPALVRIGGTLPLLAVLADRGNTSIVSGFALPDDADHAPNESYRLESLRLGEAAARELYVALAALAPGRG